LLHSFHQSVVFSMRFVTSFLFSLVLLVVCVAIPSSCNPITDWEITPQPHSLESPAANDDQVINAVWKLFQNSFVEATRTDFPTDSKLADLRQAHVKQYGCGMASMRVMDNIPPHLQVGLFKTPGATFDTMFRFSAGGGNGFVRGLGGARKQFFHLNDMEKDNRAVAVKVFGVSDTPTGTADFTFTTNECPFTRTSDEALEYFTAVGSNSTWDNIGMAVTHPHLMKLLINTVKSGAVKSLVHTPYFASAPHAMGEDQAVRMRLRPSMSNVMPTNGKSSDPHLLTDLLSSTLSQGPSSAVFFWEVQEYVDASKTPIEDPTILWDNQPWSTIAMLTLTSDHIDLPRDELLCRPTTFNPVNVPSDHRGIGGAQRMRRLVYTKLHQLRINAQGRLGMDNSHLDSMTGQPSLDWVKETWGPKTQASVDSVDNEQEQVSPSRSRDHSHSKAASVSVKVEVDIQ